jgi:hypothetical protein
MMMGINLSNSYKKAVEATKQKEEKMGKRG